MAVTVFLDTSVLLAGLVDFGPQSAPAQSLLHAVAKTRMTRTATAWHCCLEFYAVSTRLPEELRLTPADALRLVEEEILARFQIHQLPARDQRAFFRARQRRGDQRAAGQADTPVALTKLPVRRRLGAIVRNKVHQVTRRQVDAMAPHHQQHHAGNEQTEQHDHLVGRDA